MSQPDLERSESTSPEMPAREPRRTAGGLLRSARRRCGWSQEEVACQLNMLTSHIIAIDEDRLDKLPGETFVRGYVRSYARLVGEDESTVLAALNQVLQPVETRVADNVESESPAQSEGGNFWWIGIALVAALALAWWLSSADRPASAVVPAVSPVLEAPVAPSAEQETVPEPAEPMPAAPTSNEAPLVPDPAHFPGTQMADEAVPVVIPVPASDDEATLASPVLLTAVLHDPVVSPSQDILDFAFRDDCWVQVRDRNDRTLVADLKRAEETLVVTGEAPFSIVIGSVPAVTVHFNGEPVSLPDGGRSNTARFVVGKS